MMKLLKLPQPKDNKNYSPKKKQNNSAGIRKRGNKYQINVQIEKKRYWITVGTDKEEAIRYRRKLVYLADEGTLKEFFNQNEKRKITYSDAVEEHYKKHIIHLKSSERAYRALKASLIYFKEKKISSIKWDEIEEFKNRRLQEVAESTVKQELSMIGAVFERQLKNGIISDNVVKMVKPPLVRNVREKILSHKKFKKLLNVKWKYNNNGKEKEKKIENYIKLSLVIADYTAMRIGEILELTWDRINIESEEPTIHIINSKNSTKRNVPIHSQLIQILKKEKENSNCNFVIHKNNKPLKRINKGFKNACKKAKLSNVWIHDFRHRAITRWVQECKPIPAIMAATGHRTYSAFQRYTNLSEKDIQSLVNRKTTTLPLISFYDYYYSEKKGEKYKSNKEMLEERLELIE